MDTSGEMTISERKTVHLPNNETYDLWAPTYDTDGNILQALDSFRLESVLFPRLFEYLVNSLPTHNVDEAHLHLTDLGCGTGRATLALLLAFADEANSALIAELAAKGYGTIDLKGLDSSLGMLNIAKEKVPTYASNQKNYAINTTFEHFDILETTAKYPSLAGAVVSTLVLEHLPLNIYFERVVGLIRPGGILLLTNMHPDMGNADFGKSTQSTMSVSGSNHIATGAGFIDVKSNTKIRGTSYAHTIEDVLSAANAMGLELVGSVEEQAVEPWMLKDDPDTGAEALLGPRGKKWIGIKCWIGMLLQLRTA